MAYPVISKIRMLGRWQSNRGSWHLWLHSLPGPELGGILAVWGARLPLDGFQAKAGRLIPCNHMQPTLLHTVAVCRGNQLFNLVRGCPWCMATKLFRIFRVAGWTCSWIKTMQLKSPLGSKNPDANGAAVHTDFRIDVGFCAAGCFWPPWKRLEIRRQRNEVEQRHEMATCRPLKQKTKNYNTKLMTLEGAPTSICSVKALPIPQPWYSSSTRLEHEALKSLLETLLYTRDTEAHKASHEQLDKSRFSPSFKSKMYATLLILEWILAVFKAAQPTPTMRPPWATPGPEKNLWDGISMAAAWGYGKRKSLSFSLCARLRYQTRDRGITFDDMIWS